jgi:hypothetical protein
MPKGKKICPQCQAALGVRTKVCECGHEFTIKTYKQGSPHGSPIKTNANPLAQTYVPTPGLWVFDRPKDLPKIQAPGPLPDGTLTNQQVYEHVSYNGLGDCVFEYITPRKIADPKLRKKWEKAKQQLKEVWRYLIGEEPTTE